MKNLTEIKKKVGSDWFKSLQIKIINQFQLLENETSKENKKKSKIFIKREWKKNNKKEGGGVSYLLSGGELFDKIGVNQSTVSGQFEKSFRSKVLGAEKNGKYWATGISVVAHMKNPKIPAFHFNTRFITTSKEWFGGGMDATPSFKDTKEELIIHQKLKKICLINQKDYSKYKKWCDNYFYLPHRKEPRGIGGIFFDYETKNWEKNFKFVQDLGAGFIDITKQIIMSKKKLKWNVKDKEQQLYKRGRYVEFNLLYDRGTKFGLNSGGNTDSILMSLPPQAKWK
jgi:coproporphyrinogen III oxidase